MSNSFYNKDNYTQKDIEQIFNPPLEENLQLEFKESRILGNNKTSENLSIHVSSFANTIGGILILGIEEGSERDNQHIPIKLSFINGEEFSKETLENIIDSNIYPKIKGIQIFPIRFDNDIRKTVYVIKIPESKLAPHMAKDKKYYKRRNFGKYELEEHEVRLLYYRRKYSEILISNLYFDFLGNDSDEVNLKVYKLVLLVENVGEEIEHNCKIRLSFYFENNEKLKYLNSTIFKIVFKDKRSYFPNCSNDTVWDFYFSNPIFKDDTTCVYKCLFYIMDSEWVFDFIKENLKIDVKIFSSNNTDELTLTLKNIESFKIL